jgi:D-xylose transport system substrate-binding protein
MITTLTRRMPVCAAAVLTALAAVACGKAGGSLGGNRADAIGLLLPDTATARWEGFDRPLIEQAVRTLCPRCTIEHANAGGDPAVQTQQVTTMITKGVKVLILDPQDAVGIASSVRAAVAKGVHVVAYDRPAQGPVSAYVSYDNEKVGELQGQALLAALGAAAGPRTEVVMIDGDDVDPNAAQFKAGAHKVLDGKVDIAYEQSGMWKDTVADRKMTAAITRLGANHIAGVYAANDTMAGGVATALRSAGMHVPLTGQDADLAALQRILGGTQTATVYKAYRPEAEAAARIAVDLLRGADFSDVTDTTVRTGSGQRVPARLLTPVSVTRANIADTVVRDGMYPVDRICTAQFARACAAAGIR